MRKRIVIVRHLLIDVCFGSMLGQLSLQCVPGKVAEQCWCYDLCCTSVGFILDYSLVLEAPQRFTIEQLALQLWPSVAHNDGYADPDEGEVNQQAVSLPLSGRGAVW